MITRLATALLVLGMAQPAYAADDFSPSDTVTVHPYEDHQACVTDGELMHPFGYDRETGEIDVWFLPQIERWFDTSGRVVSQNVIHLTKIYPACWKKYPEAVVLVTYYRILHGQRHWRYQSGTMLSWDPTSE